MKVSLTLVCETVFVAAAISSIQGIGRLSSLLVADFADGTWLAALLVAFLLCGAFVEGNSFEGKTGVTFGGELALTESRAGKSSSWRTPLPFDGFED